MVLGVCDLEEGLGSQSLKCQAEELCPWGDGEPQGGTGPVLDVGRSPPWGQVRNRLEGRNWELGGQGGGWMIAQVEKNEA